MLAVPIAILERVAFEAAVRSLQDQDVELIQLRSRTGTLLAAGSLTASFLGAQTLGHAGHLTLFAGLALISFVVSILPCIYILAPKRDLVFSVSGPVLYEAMLDVREDEAEILRRAAYWFEQYWKDNREKIEKLTPFFGLASIALVAEIVFWALALRDTLV